MTTCCHYRLWRPFSGDKKSSHFSASFLTAIQTRNSVFRARLRLRIFYFKPLACTFRHCFTDYPTISINTTSVTTVSYGFTLNLHANVTDLPEGARVVWSMDGSGFELIPSADGMTCGVKSVSKGSATITAKVVDKNGNTVKDAKGGLRSVLSAV